MLSLANLFTPAIHHTPIGTIQTSEFEILKDGLSVGVVEFSFDEDYLYVFNIFIESDHRGKGIASEWLESFDLIVAIFNPVEEAKDFWSTRAHEVYYI